MGPRLQSKIRAPRLRPATGVLLISGYLDRDFGNFVIDPGLPFLQKPFSPTALAALVRDVLDAA